MGDRWYVYVLVSTTSNRTYVGVTVDTSRRLQEHNGELPGGAKSTRSGRPWRIGRVYGPCENRSAALRLEHRIKRETGINRLAVDDQADAEDAALHERESL